MKGVGLVWNWRKDGSWCFGVGKWAWGVRFIYTWEVIRLEMGRLSCRRWVGKWLATNLGWGMVEKTRLVRSGGDGAEGGDGRLRVGQQFFLFLFFSKYVSVWWRCSGSALDMGSCEHFVGLALDAPTADLDPPDNHSCGGIYSIIPLRVITVVDGKRKLNSAWWWDKSLSGMGACLPSLILVLISHALLETLFFI